MARNTENRAKLETHTVELVIWRETLKCVKKKRNTHCWTWIVVRKLKNMENETHTMYDLEHLKT